MVLSYGYFVYRRDEERLLSSISACPLDSTFEIKSDIACKAVTWEELIGGMLTYELGSQHNLPSRNPAAVIEKHCYKCLRAPWIHELMIDAQSGTVYHSVSEIRK